MTDTTEVFVYIGRKVCGCARAIVVDEPKYAKDTAKTIARWIREGWTIERLPLEEGRAALNPKCDHK